MESKTTAIRTIKQEVRLQEWSVQIKAQRTGLVNKRAAESAHSNSFGYIFLRAL